MAITINGKEFADMEEFSRRGRGCATKIPTPVDMFRVDEELLSNRQRRVSFDTLHIEIRFIHLTYGSQGLISLEQRERQVELLNDAFSGSNLVFGYNEELTRSVDNHDWYRMGHGSFAEREAKSALSSDPTKYLNFYTAGLQNGLLGWATFPFDLAGDPVRDGVVVLDESLPGGNAAPFNLGMTAVHEVGHWLGLYHTFQDGCSGFGDHVEDTPAHSGPNYGKPADGQPHNACNAGEFAPIHNYMNYVDDEWMNELTDKQENRVKEQIMMYRTGLLNNDKSCHLEAL
ncbi:zinc metalloprotease [Leptobacterium flavescens]|uniref:Zinc metalloprotease n=1 Tax=Leptobacterium flavescens TaxID=472055 RepID=A0A6P0UP09_9FLAO|nr:zinc metalloprotease [Leptobacterium flavescens]NER14717.1 zinc metalloprotease [Leptobacterium flavescens]